MSTDSEVDQSASPKKSKLPLILGLIFLIVGAGGGFAAVSLGLIAGDTETTENTHSGTVRDIEEPKELAFLALDPIIFTVSRDGTNHLIRFTAQLDVNPQYLSEIDALKPRIVDILNGYLRAIELEDLEASNALLTLRSQMLHRVRIVTGENRVNDLLVMELIIN